MKNFNINLGWIVINFEWWLKIKKMRKISVLLPYGAHKVNLHSDDEGYTTVNKISYAIRPFKEKYSVSFDAPPDCNTFLLINKEEIESGKTSKAKLHCYFGKLMQS